MIMDSIIQNASSEWKLSIINRKVSMLLHYFIWIILLIWSSIGIVHILMIWLWNIWIYMLYWWLILLFLWCWYILPLKKPFFKYKESDNLIIDNVILLLLILLLLWIITLTLKWFLKFNTWDLYWWVSLVSSFFLWFSWLFWIIGMFYSPTNKVIIKILIFLHIPLFFFLWFAWVSL